MLLRCSTSTVQPGELFPLFPEHTRPWAGRKLHARQHWGLQPPLADLETLIDRMDRSENSRGSAQENGNASVKHRMAAAARQCVADYLLEVRCLKCASCLPAGVLRLLAWLLPGVHSLTLLTAGQLAYPRHVICLQAGALACLLRCVWALMLPAAGQVRHWEGAEVLDGIDTLLVHLLADADSAAALESFAAAPNEVCCPAS